MYTRHNSTTNTHSQDSVMIWPEYTTYKQIAEGYRKSMGQYYLAVNIDDMEYVSPHKYDNGAKLMEHSYIGNNFVEAVEFLLLDTGEGKGRWSGKRIVWAGDYADPEEYRVDNLYNIVEGDGLQMLIEAVPEDYKYLINLDKKEYVDKSKCPSYGTWGMRIHPLPLLTAEGNGRGGGDYRGDNDQVVGSWARDRVALVKDIPEGFTELIPNLIE